MVARPGDALLAVGFVYPATNAPVTPQSVSRWSDDLGPRRIHSIRMELLGASVLEQVQRNLGACLVPMIALVLLSLGLAFRRVKEMTLSLLVLLLSGLCLLTVMRLSGWSWNLLNLMALPLMLGSGWITASSCNWRCAVIAAICARPIARRTRPPALRRYRRAGFGSLAWSTNAGMASLGKCAPWASAATC